MDGLYEGKTEEDGFVDGEPDGAFDEGIADGFGLG